MKVQEFYEFKKSCKEAQKVQSSCSNDAAEKSDQGQLHERRHQVEDDDDDDENLIYSTVQIVKNFIKKHAVHQIKEDESGKQLIIMSGENLSRDEEQLVSSSTTTMNAFQQIVSIKREPIVEIKIEPLEIKEEGEADEILGLNLDFTSNEELTNSSSDNSLSKLPAFCNDRIFDGNRFVLRSEILQRKSKKELKKRERRPEFWASSIQKKLKNTGQQYRSAKGYVVAAKSMGTPCNCRKDCTNKINESNRLINFKHYWKFESVNDKKKFIMDHITLVRPKRALSKSRAFSRIMHHYLDVTNSDGTIEQIKVCKKMFCNTLNISNSVLTNAFKIKDQYFEMDK